MRDSLIFYRSFYESMKQLDSENKSKLFDVIMEYGLNEAEIECEGLVKALFLLIKPQIDANNRRRANGMKGGRPKETEAEKNERFNKAIEEARKNRKITKR